MIATLVGCAQQTAQEPQETTELINGTFEGTAAGMQGPVTVSITVEESKITGIEIK